MHERALRTFEAKFGPEHPRVSIAHLRMGIALIVLDSHADALEHLHQALRIMAASKGAEYVDAQIIRINIGEALYKQGLAKQAVAELRGAAEVLERTHSPDTVLGGALVQLGLALLEAGELTARTAATRTRAAVVRGR